jgi:hypothetical protein
VSDRFFACLFTVVAVVAAGYVFEFRWETVRRAVLLDLFPGLRWLTANGARVGVVALALLSTLLAVYYWKRVYVSLK